MDPREKQVDTEEEPCFDYIPDLDDIPEYIDYNEEVLKITAYPKDRLEW